VIVGCRCNDVDDDDIQYVMTERGDSRQPETMNYHLDSPSLDSQVRSCLSLLQDSAIGRVRPSVSTLPFQPTGLLP